MNQQNDKMFFYERFARHFDTKMNMYDCSRRLEIIFDELLGLEDLSGKAFLDAGCGTGYFSKKARERGACVISMDLGPNLLKLTQNKSNVTAVIGDVQRLCFGPSVFHYVLATEVIEHTKHPEQAISELIRVLRPGGILIVTVPNKVWHFSVRIANMLKLRPYEGYENWVQWSKMKKIVLNNNGRIIEMKGFHLFPFVCKWFNEFLRYMDRFGNKLGPIMLNIAVKITKSK